jgi:predicted peptidase
MQAVTHNGMKNQWLKWILVGFCGVLAVGGVAIVLRKPEPPPPYQERVYASTEGVRMPYRLYVPPNYDAKQKYPLVIWLHGSDAIGTDNLKQITGHNDAGTRVWTVHWKDFPTLVVAPQSYERYWSLQPSPLPAEEPLVMNILAALEREFNIDPDRIYLAGQSMGGFGVWEFLEQRPDFYAAAIVLCGPVGPGMISDAHTIAYIPVWVFQGAKDDVVSVAGVRSMLESLRMAGGHPRYTEYPDLGHVIGPASFAESGLLPWLFAQKRDVRRQDLIQVE